MGFLLRQQLGSPRRREAWKIVDTGLNFLRGKENCKRLAAAFQIKSITREKGGGRESESDC